MAALLSSEFATVAFHVDRLSERGATLRMSHSRSVRQAREAAGLSQRELARRMGTSQAAVVRLESGGVAATLTTLQRVATPLGLEVNVESRPSA